MANSSARVMGTCAILGEAIGTASYIAKKYSCSPREVMNHIDELQQTILFNDGFIPNVKRTVSRLSLSSSINENDILRNGQDRDIGESKNSIKVENGKVIKYEIKDKYVKQIKIVFDSDLLRNTFTEMHESEKIHPTRSNILLDSPTMFMPTTLAKEFSIVCKDKNNTTIFNFDEQNNIRRNIILDVNKKCCSVELVIKSNYGGTDATNLFTFEIK